MEKISEIKATLEAADIAELPFLVERYTSDEREGVKKLLEKVQKKLDAYAAELARTEKMKMYVMALGIV